MAKFNTIQTFDLMVLTVNWWNPGCTRHCGKAIGEEPVSKVVAQVCSQFEVMILPGWSVWGLGGYRYAGDLQGLEMSLQLKYLCEGVMKDLCDAGACWILMM
jgi:hypothetical protein